jgi:hypothetical protein
MPKLRSAPQEAHRKSVESSTSDVVGYLQEVLGQKLVAHIAGVSDPRTVARWAAGERAPRAEHEQRNLGPVPTDPSTPGGDLANVHH